MSKPKFMLLIVMMVLSMTGIIWVQAIWIRNAYEIRNENFNNAVVSSLNNAAEHIMSLQRINFFNNYLPSGAGYPVRPPDYLNIRKHSQMDSGGYVFNSKSYVFTGNDAASDSAMLVVASKGGGRDDVWNPNARPLSERQHDFITWVKQHTNEFHNLSDQFIMEIYQWEKTLDIGNADINNVLRQTFEYAGIHTPYEFAVIKNGQTQEGEFKRNSADFFKSGYMVRLFPGNMIRQDIVLSVIFPARANYVLGQVFWLLGGSLAFSLFIVATFGLSLYFIVRQKKISEMKSDFLNNMTHEFKTPIATISLAADTISNPKIICDEAKIMQFVGMIKKENSRMNKRVETILQIASLDKREILFNFENTSMHTVIDHVLEAIEIQVQRKNGTVVKVYDAANSFVSGDSEHLSNLVNNLLDNAIKYSPENPEITVETKNSSNCFIFSVEDKGTGMTKAIQSKIFERFYRQPSGNIHNVKGFGLGLHYVRTIVEAHKGTISVTSEPGKGSRFEVTLPLNTEY
ncbi:MAG: HAMP domain-containing histidine kinase [Bacteroidales bacterium]|jgi:two-component system phosphate regulon sensor histidine kinase PhoR|nr:HAMP domain-containing histidine kinase [Bacteroidales bacterium]